MPELTVTSEIYEEYNYQSTIPAKNNGNIISEFPFTIPNAQSCKAAFDEDDDLDIVRARKEVVTIEHCSKTAISLVGLQVWRGAFLLGDLLIHLGLQGDLKDKTVLELGAGTGFTSFVAAMFAKKVVCTDLNFGGILELIKLNASYNESLIQSEFKVMSLDFTKSWCSNLQKHVEESDIVIAADVIYDDDVTAAFVSTIQKILNTKPPKTLYVVLEKRYVFTIEHLDSIAPCYETFLSLLDKVKAENDTTWTLELMSLDFPKYFTYDRVKELVMWKIQSKAV